MFRSVQNGAIGDGGEVIKRNSLMAGRRARQALTSTFAQPGFLGIGNLSRMRFPLIMSLCLLASAARGFGAQAAPIVQQQDAPNVGNILDRMKAHDKWQERYLVE